ncbi:arabinan endo-1,5-alpha-L-arabinosidase [Actinoplanes sp. L3-i22]|uniref:arabinan endo-1,5-alpha-L-arabinosidase n=1 Tax=Actinoplanes sp. L3-i22 TaxID=2836373 RepID=UPI001C76C5DE|nr:arabinan endo-1,5-alpha-L-arabinosidase [Actinoplanes sp. L3-i22]BCY10188.1 arabinan endo-1,5-alpha-L-arabinosidase [Actinoplanes sp. L3-i22]
MSRIALAAALLLLSACTAAPPAPVRPAAYPDPILVLGDTNAHDPSLARTPAGGYLLAVTGANIPLKTSADLSTWTAAGPAFPSGTPWTKPYTADNKDLWAPDISYHDGQYFMYYSASSFGSNHSAIFLATSPTGESGSWIDRGLVVESARSDDFNAIDPNLYVDDDGWRLTFGSFWTGIKQIRLDPSTGLRRGGTMIGLAGRGDTAIEAPYLVKHGSYYYLWVSFDACCKGAASTYRTMVGRASSPEGPFADRDGTPMTAGGGTEVVAGHGSIHGPGHEAVLGDLLIYHYYADSGASYLGINSLAYDGDGWPFIYTPTSP